MRVELAIDIFTDQNSLRDILNILDCFTKECHDWHVAPDGILAAEKYLLKTAPHIAATAVQLGQKAMVNAAWQSIGEQRIIAVTRSELREAANDLCRQAVLVVENASSDGDFIRAIAMMFQNRRVLRALDENWIVIRQAGGSREVKPVAKSERAMFVVHIRVAALFDSDSMTPGAQTMNHRDADTLKLDGIFSHVLRLREAENYVPHKVLAMTGRRREISRKLDHFKRLNRVQQGYFDMKSGFKMTNSGPQVPTTQQELYEDLTPEALRSLCGGFGDELLHLFTEHADTIPTKDFAHTEIEAELRDLLSMIESVI